MKDVALAYLWSPEIAEDCPVPIYWFNFSTSVCFRLKLSHFLVVAKFFVLAKVQEDEKFLWQYGSAQQPTC